jgi:hypothetical protein
MPLHFDLHFIVLPCIFETFNNPTLRMKYSILQGRLDALIVTLLHNVVAHVAKS